MILENIRNALRSIRSAKVRSTLTMLGMIIGVYAVVTMLSIGNGVKAQVTQQISDLGTNLLTISSGHILGSQTSSSGQKKMSGGLNFTSSLGASTLTAADATKIAAERTCAFDACQTRIGRDEQRNGGRPKCCGEMHKSRVDADHEFSAREKRGERG